MAGSQVIGSGRSMTGPIYPMCLRWSPDENLIAVGLSHIINVLDPHELGNPRGIIRAPADKKFFEVGKPVKADHFDNQLLPANFERNTGLKTATRIAYRSIDWSPAGCAAGGGCLLVACTTDYQVQILAPPPNRCTSEWRQVANLSDQLYMYVMQTCFRAPPALAHGVPSFASFDVSAIPEAEDNENDDGRDGKMGVKRKHKDYLSVSTKRIGRPKKTETSMSLIPTGPDNVNYQGKPDDVVAADEFVRRHELVSPTMACWSPVFTPDQASVPEPPFVLLCIGCKSGTLNIFRHRLPGLDEATGSVASAPKLVTTFASECSWVASAGWSPSIGPHGEALHDAALLAVGGADGSVRVYHFCAALGATAGAQDGSQGAGLLVTFSSLVCEAEASPVSVTTWAAPSVGQRPLLAIAKGMSVALWEGDVSGPGPIPTSRQCCTHNAHDRQVTGVVFGKERTTIYTCGLDGSVRLWFVQGSRAVEGAEPLALELLGHLVSGGHSQGIYGLGISNNAALLAYCREKVPSGKRRMYETRQRTGHVIVLNCASGPADHIDRLHQYVVSSLHGLAGSDSPLYVWDVVDVLNSHRAEDRDDLIRSVADALETSYFTPGAHVTRESARMLRIATQIRRHAKMTLDDSIQLNRANLTQNVLELQRLHCCAVLGARPPTILMGVPVEEQQSALLMADWLAWYAAARPDCTELSASVYAVLDPAHAHILPQVVAIRQQVEAGMNPADLATAEGRRRRVAQLSVSGVPAAASGLPLRDSCPFCGSHLTVADTACAQGHPVARCLLTLNIVSTSRAFRCQGCAGNALRSSPCPLCDLPLSRSL